ncbi:Tetratricopeptide repeat-domain-containing protein [Kalaharituber pfeilii]|nr:Tetratricopeptide repeat-domain-containing protein [Kalaharituber pfeilii]
MGQHDKALEYFQRALVGREKALGTEHPDTLTTVHNIGRVFKDMGQHDKALEYYQRALYDKALEYYQRALVGRQKVLGLDHPDTLVTINYMATLLDEIRHSDQAQKLRERTSHGSSTNARE